MRSGIFPFILLVVVACSAGKEHTNYKFAKEKFRLQTPTLLRTDGVYVQTISDSNAEGKLNSQFAYYRFYEDGRCYVSDWINGVPHDADLRLTSKEFGQHAYYRNTGSEVKVEIWGGAYFGYGYRVGYVDSTHLKLIYAQPRGIGAAKQYYGYESPPSLGNSKKGRVEKDVPGEIYVFRKVDMTNQLDW